jgi:cytochrome c2
LRGQNGWLKYRAILTGDRGPGGAPKWPLQGSGRFAYSAANKNSGDIRNAQTLDACLADPRKFIPGTKMVFAGLKSAEDRKALIEYLKEEH